MKSTIDWSALFADYGATAGGVYEFCDLSTLFKDTAGTTPVAAVGDSIALIKDKSGLGHDFSQANPANQPSYYVDAQGIGMARFTAAHPSYMDGSGLNCNQCTVFAAFYYTTAAAGRILDARGIGNAGTTKGWAFSAADGGGAAIFIADDGSGNYVYDDGHAFLPHNMAVFYSYYIKGDSNIWSKAITQAGDRSVYLGAASVRQNILGDITSTAQCRMGAPSNDLSTHRLDGYLAACGVIPAVLSGTDRNRLLDYLRDVASSV